MPEQVMDGAAGVIRTVFHLDPGTEIPLVDPYALDQIDEQPLQVRSDKNLAPKAMVDRYVIQMDSSVFPPLVVTEDSVLADGHTRKAARELRGETTDRALVIPARWDAGPDTQALIVLTGQILNQQAGQALDNDEQRSMVENCLQAGFGFEMTAAYAGVSTGKVRQVEQERAASVKMARLGITTKPLPVTVKAALGRAAGPHGLHDQPFKALVQLTADAGLAPAEINEVTRLATSAGSDDEATAIVDARRAAEGARILEKTRSGNGHPPLSQYLAMHIGWINKYGVQPAMLVEPRPLLQAGALDRVTQAASILAEVVRLQELENS